MDASSVFGTGSSPRRNFRTDTQSGQSVGMIPYLTQTYEIFNLQNIHLNLAVIQLDLGIRFAPNLISILGILAAGWIFHKV